MLELKLLFLIVLANGAPIIVDDILRHRPGRAIDGGRRWRDGQPLLGAAKTWRGLISAIALSAAAGGLVGLGVSTGMLVGTAAMAGDLISSFVKRRLHRPVSGMVPGLDQIPESLLPLLAVQSRFALDSVTIGGLVLAFIVLELALSRVLFKLRLRQRPY